MTPSGSQPDHRSRKGGRSSSSPGAIHAGVAVALGATLSGLALGALWLWLAPRVPLVSDGKEVFLKDGEGEDTVARDGWFALLGMGLGVVSAVAVFLRYRKGGVGAVVGLALGGLLASLVGWRFGVWLGPSGDVAERAREVGAGSVFDAPMALEAKAALLAWPIGAMIAHLLLTGAFVPHDPPSAPVTGTDGGRTKDAAFPSYPAPCPQDSHEGRGDRHGRFRRGGQGPREAVVEDPRPASRPPRQH